MSGPEKNGQSKSWIRVIGAREHNLKNITVELPKDALTVITGPSGSGKSSLALDILYTEGQRRYVESLSSYARQFLGVGKKPDVDAIEGLCPAVAIEQKTVGSNPRSTVGTITEIYDYLRVLFARIGVVHCPNCAVEITSESPDKVTEVLVAQFDQKLVVIAAPIAREQKGEFVHELTKLFQSGHYRFIIDGVSYKFKSLAEIEALRLKKTYKHTIDVIIDAVEVSMQERARLQTAIEASFALANNMCKITVDQKEYLYSSERMCVHCGDSIAELEPRSFSFNSPIGACTSCQGLGVLQGFFWNYEDRQNTDDTRNSFTRGNSMEFQANRRCTDCGGARLNKYALAVTIGGQNIVELGNRSVASLMEFFQSVQLDEVAREIGGALIKEIISRLTFLDNVGLAYLTLSRTAQTLSGGEGQRIRLATQIGSMLSGVLYVLDEPSIGLHQRDNDRLIATLKTLRDQGNSVVVVEHDMDTIMHADYVIDMGPAAGVLGGQVVAAGTPEELQKDPNSLTGAYMSGKRGIRVPQERRKPSGYLVLANAHKNNLRHVTVQFPLGVMCVISGVSGSGKSTLIMEEMVALMKQRLERSGFRAHKQDIQDTHLSGGEGIRAMVVIDQSPIGRTPRSNPATYLGIFDDIRKLFASLPESNARGYTVGRFSFNVAEGRCSECNGDGQVTFEMHFLPEVTMQCKVCKGKRYNQQTLQITYKDKNIADVLRMTVYEARDFFAHHKQIHKRLQLLCDVGLDYLQLGQPSTTLSGGEAQRIKLVDELAKRGQDTLYILDEPTTGLHSSDIERLLIVLNRLIEKGNSMIIIEHNLDVLKTVDYIIDMGPEGGDGGGLVVAHGTPEEVAHSLTSHTGRYLQPLLQKTTRVTEGT